MTSGAFSPDSRSATAPRGNRPSRHTRKTTRLDQPQHSTAHTNPGRSKSQPCKRHTPLSRGPTIDGNNRTVIALTRSSVFPARNPLVVEVPAFSQAISFSRRLCEDAGVPTHLWRALPTLVQAINPLATVTPSNLHWLPSPPFLLLSSLLKQLSISSLSSGEVRGWNLCEKNTPAPSFISAAE